MKPGWAAGSVRARLLATRQLGPAGARSIAATGEIGAAIASVAASPYGRDVRDEMGLVDAQRGVRATALWHLRVLAGWLPPGRSEVVRVLAGGYEIANVEGHLDELSGRPGAPPFELGALATAWPHVRGARSVAEARRALGASAWGDPGTDDRASTVTALHLACDRRIAEQLPELRRWASAHAAILVAGERFGFDRELSPSATVDAERLLGPVGLGVGLEAFVARLPSDARWVFADVADAHELWRAEAAWWRALGDEAARRVGRVGAGRAVVAWSAVLLLADVHRVCGALEAAAWGRAGVEAFDAVA